MATLPFLSGEELQTFFNADSNGLRRYRLLHAVLVDHMTQREAAQAVGVSERTVRNVLQAFTRSGHIEALRSRVNSPRRRRNGNSITRALSTALAEDPHAGGDRLWKRAQELLGDTGQRISRRTAYRILAQLRSTEPQDTTSVLLAAIRTALPLLPEDPPLSLGNTVLAQRLLTNENDPLLRGLLLQQGLRTALDRLRPAGATSTLDRTWWPYLICAGEYENSQTRAELQDSLALSASTYTRAKRYGLARIATVLPQILERMIESPSTLVCQRLPRTLDFVGRHEEESYYTWRLQTEGLVHIWGLPGSGKTSLAAELAAEGHRYGQTILWHTCRVGRDATLMGIIQSLLAGLHLLTKERQDPLDLLELLRDRLIAHASVIVIDDIHNVDPLESAPLFDLLHQLVARRATRLILVGRDRPAIDNWSALPGLTETEARLLWANVPALPAEQWTALYTATRGFPQPLRMAAAAYRRAGELAHPTDWRTDVAAWVQEAIWSQIDRPAQRLLAASQALDPQLAHLQPEILCESLGIPVTTLQTLQSRGLISETLKDANWQALQAGTEKLLRDDDELKSVIEKITARFTNLSAITENMPSATIVPSAVTSSGMELLTRLSAALETSAAYLQSRHGDRDARAIAHELMRLQAALPYPGGPQRP